MVLDLRWGSKPLIPVTSDAGAAGQYSGHVTGEFSHVPGPQYGDVRIYPVFKLYYTTTTVGPLANYLTFLNFCFLI